MGAEERKGVINLTYLPAYQPNQFIVLPIQKSIPKLIRLLARQHGQCNLAQILPSSEYIAIVQYFLHFLKGKYAILKPA